MYIIFIVDTAFALSRVSATFVTNLTLLFHSGPGSATICRSLPNVSVVDIKILLTSLSVSLPYAELNVLH